ncbi:MAG: hemolysin III family protein [Bacteroidia bacterium]|nr:hemolysin III family protein [Bacteroidia bacterium]
MNEGRLKYYSREEEALNVITHGIGLGLSLAAIVFLVFHAIECGTTTHIISFSIFGLSMILLYAASTSYHYVQKPDIRRKLNILDHAAIYILIAGTYTPFTLITLKGWIGWTIFGVVWSIAILGVCFKLFYTGRFDKISTLGYVAIGWIAIFAIKPLIDNLPLFGLYWVVAGGILYTIGALLYILPRLKYNHAIFHVFVLLGSISHFIAVYYYV